MKKIVIFASGSGSNAENIYNQLHKEVEIQCIYCNHPKAGVIERAERLKIPLVLFNRSEWTDSQTIENQIAQLNPDLIVLAGFLWKVPENFVARFPQKIINIHPALLPNYGGKGMYGHHVHEAVIAANETKSGITIHYINEHYDEGEYILQAECSLDSNDTADTLAQKIHELEFKYFPLTIQKLLNA
jgi:phosphoribosylglycinamide formyltransferase-1